MDMISLGHQGIHLMSLASFWDDETSFGHFGGLRDDVPNPEGLYIPKVQLWKYKSPRTVHGGIGQVWDMTMRC